MLRAHCKAQIGAWHAHAPLQALIKAAQARVRESEGRFSELGLALASRIIDAVRCRSMGVSVRLRQGALIVASESTAMLLVQARVLDERHEAL